MATPAATATASSTALHGYLTACHDNPHGTPMSTAPRVTASVRVKVPWYAVEVRGRFRGMPWKFRGIPGKGLPQVGPRHCHGMSRNILQVGCSLLNGHMKCTHIRYHCLIQGGLATKSALESERSPSEVNASQRRCMYPPPPPTPPSPGR